MLLPKDLEGCPYLILAPMEGVGDRSFRQAMASVGGFNEAVMDFLRVPANAHVKSLAKEYQADETAPIPLAAQLMGSDPALMAAMAQEIEKRGAPRIDVNCGCPSNTVTGRGAGSSLLKTPNLLNEVAQAVVKAVNIPVTVKMRSGYEDTSLFKENLLAAQESGISYLTLHPRTKVEGYGPPANWDLIAEAKAILHIPVVGNGDILNVSDALKMLKYTNCDALMIGRGSVINPFIFHQIRAHFSGKEYLPTWSQLHAYLQVYLQSIPEEMPTKTRINKMKQLMSFLFKSNSVLLEKKKTMLTTTFTELAAFLEFTIPLLKSGWN
ncbi:tRNA-dihydrouridine synthase C [Chlamydiales bacterium STE3]|nr:tRNA-dihydrouridine synthase C [Chlamydiales bacterium STE3]